MRIGPIEINPRSWGAATGAALAAGTGLFLLLTEWGTGLRHLSYDLPHAARPHEQPEDAVLVYLDDDSHAALGQPHNAPWDRSLHARLLDRLTAEGARAVVFDIVFSDPGPDPEADRELARAIRENGRVILAADHVPTGYGREGIAAKQVVPPFEPFTEHAADIASAEMNPDGDLIVRRHVPSSRDDLIAPLSWSAARLLGAGVTAEATNQYSARWMKYYGPPAHLPNVSFHRALPGDSPDRVPDGYFTGKTVFVGARLLTKFSGERKDEFPTPYSRWGRFNRFMPGVEIQATAFLNLLRGDWLNRLPAGAETAMVALLGLAIGAGMIRLRPVAATGAAALCAAAAAAAAHAAFTRHHIWFPWLIVAAQAGVALGWSVVFNSIRLYVENRLFVQSLELYLSPKLVKKFAKAQDRRLLEPGAEKQVLTILFSDIADFTTISEGMDSDELARLMNRYFETAVSGCIHRTDGTVVKYIGDAIFAFWNAPEPQTDHARRACEAALRFRDLGAQIVNGRQLYTRIGLHTGTANVGNFGSTTRIDYTALGESINLASRMEGLNKHLGTRVLITGDTLAETGNEFVTRPLGLFQLKGFEKSVEVLELVDRRPQAGDTQPMRSAFARALEAYQQRDFDGAEAGFRRVLELAPGDGPSEFYLRETAHCRREPPPDDWRGEVELKEK